MYRPQTVNKAGNGGFVDLGTGEVLGRWLAKAWA